MQKLISLDELMKFPVRADNYDKEHGNEHFMYGIETVLEYAQSLPVVETEEVKYGMWLDVEWDDSVYIKEGIGETRLWIVKGLCSECHSYAYNRCDYAPVMYPICPKCGVKMIGWH